MKGTPLDLTDVAVGGLDELIERVHGLDMEFAERPYYFRLRKAQWETICDEAYGIRSCYADNDARAQFEKGRRVWGLPVVIVDE